MHHNSQYFPENVKKALKDENLQRAMGNVGSGFVQKRAKARAALPEFDALRDHAKKIKDHTLAHLDVYLEEYEARVIESGGNVHWASTSQDAQQIVMKIAERANAKTVTKGKSMVSEEVEINKALEDMGINVVETDLGEYIIQLRGQTPSHIIAPALHVNKDEVEADFRKHHSHLEEGRDLNEAESLLSEARGILREKFLQSDIGITGANFLIAETGTSVIVTNEGNGDLTSLLPKIHIVITGIEKVVPTLNDASQMIRLLARSATGQEISVYTTFSTGPKALKDPDGPEEYHVILLDNGRSNLIGTEFQDVLRCIRCGACINHCPVYKNIGGHAYGSVYPGPIGSVITPALNGIEKSAHLPNASTFCGRCEAVCPMRIPLPKMMRHWREKEFERHLTPKAMRRGLFLWAFGANHPKLYRFGSDFMMRVLSWRARKSGRFQSLPFAKGWTKYRDLPAPQGASFQTQYKKRKKTSNL